MDNPATLAQPETKGENTSSPDDPVLPWKILVGTHHKTGTVWLNAVFRSICLYYKLKYRFSCNSIPEDNLYDLFFHHASRFDESTLTQPFRGLHMIRDPREIIVSGCFYHLRSNESWLFQPNGHLKGRTYKESICSLGSLDEQLLFEMEYHGSWTIKELSTWNYSNPSFFEVKYEELI